jgi:hypothetical protein
VPGVDRCAGCGFEYDLGDAPRAGLDILTGVAELAELLGSARDVRERPDPATWSPIEYGCHVRDVLLVQRERVLAALITERPSCDPMHRDERAEYDGYAEQAPDRVARQLDEAAYLFANVLAHLAPRDWDRVLMYNYPARFERSLRWVAVHTVHEVRHHLLDVRRQLS